MASLGVVEKSIGDWIPSTQDKWREPAQADKCKYRQVFLSPPAAFRPLATLWSEAWEASSRTAWTGRGNMGVTWITCLVNKGPDHQEGRSGMRSQRETREAKRRGAKGVWKGCKNGSMWRQLP